MPRERVGASETPSTRPPALVASPDARDQSAVVVTSVSDLEAIVERALRRVLDAVPAQQPEQEWLGDDEAAVMLGVARSYLRKVPGLPVHRVGRKRRYRRSELVAFIEGRSMQKEE